MIRTSKLGPPYLTVTFRFRIMHGNQTQLRHETLTAFYAEDETGSGWYLFEPGEARKFDRAFAGWTMLWPRGDTTKVFPRKLVRGEVELTWDGSTWCGVPPDDREAFQVMRAAWHGSIPIGRPRLEDDDLIEREAEVLSAIRRAREPNPTRDAVAAEMGWMSTQGPDWAFRETVRQLGGWKTALERAREVER